MLVSLIRGSVSFGWIACMLRVRKVHSIDVILKRLTKIDEREVEMIVRGVCRALTTA